MRREIRDVVFWIVFVCATVVITWGVALFVMR
jgi:hypothetical protein